ncbi:MAG: hypothetical protein AAFW89_13025 [Bacteroidota bacterium]
MPKVGNPMLSDRIGDDIVKTGQNILDRFTRGLEAFDQTRTELDAINQIETTSGNAALPAPTIKPAASTRNTKIIIGSSIGVIAAILLAKRYL